MFVSVFFLVFYISIFFFRFFIFLIFFSYFFVFGNSRKYLELEYLILLNSYRIKKYMQGTGASTSLKSIIFIFYLCCEE